MRLINVTTNKLEEFMSGIPKYCILSHTWEAEEITLQEFVRGTGAVKTKSGYAKVCWACQQTRRLGLDYLWVDTCCIDKTSSAELSEAVNSMFQWYQQASKCIALLSDLAPKQDLARAQPEGHAAVATALGGCRWFRRGWTLQELLAPETVDFYDAGHCLRWSKAAIYPVLSEITGIHYKALHGRFDVASWSVASRLSWFGDRQTTRQEDLAYCLLGILDVNMPLLYGEGGRKAFARLQQEVIRSSSDTSIFAWSELPHMVHITSISLREPRESYPVLAPHPRQFSLAAGPETRSTESTVTNVGVRLTTNHDVFVRPVCLDGCVPAECCCGPENRVYFLQLGEKYLHDGPSPDVYAVGILLDRSPDRRFHRIFNGIVLCDTSSDFAADIWSLRTVGQDESDSIILAEKPATVHTPALQDVLRIYWKPALSVWYMVGFPAHHWNYAHRVFVNVGEVFRRGCLDSWSLLTMTVVLEKEGLAVPVAVGVNRSWRALFICDASVCYRTIRTLEREASTLSWEDALDTLGSKAESAMLADHESRAPLSVSTPVSGFWPDAVRVSQMVNITCEVKDCGKDEHLFLDATPIEDTDRAGMAIDVIDDEAPGESNGDGMATDEP